MIVFSKWLMLCLSGMLWMCLIPAIQAQDNACESELFAYGRYECSFQSTGSEEFEFDCEKWVVYNATREVLAQGTENDFIWLGEAGNYRVVCHDGMRRITLIRHMVFPTPIPTSQGASSQPARESPGIASGIAGRCINELVCGLVLAIFGAVSQGIKWLFNRITGRKTKNESE
jgi:hypothetical protein